MHFKTGRQPHSGHPFAYLLVFSTVCQIRKLEAVSSKLWPVSAIWPWHLGSRSNLTRRIGVIGPPIYGIIITVNNTYLSFRGSNKQAMNRFGHLTLTLWVKVKFHRPYWTAIYGFITVNNAYLSSRSSNKQVMTRFGHLTLTLGVKVKFDPSYWTAIYGFITVNNAYLSSGGNIKQVMTRFGHLTLTFGVKVKIDPS